MINKNKIITKHKLNFQRLADCFTKQKDQLQIILEEAAAAVLGKTGLPQSK